MFKASYITWYRQVFYKNRTKPLHIWSGCASRKSRERKRRFSRNTGKNSVILYSIVVTKHLHSHGRRTSLKKCTGQRSFKMQSNHFLIQNKEVEEKNHMLFFLTSNLSFPSTFLISLQVFSLKSSLQKKKSSLLPHSQPPPNPLL